MSKDIRECIRKERAYNKIGTSSSTPLDLN